MDDVETQVALAYRAVLRRDPDRSGLSSYGEALRNGRDFAWLVAELAKSDEFRARLAAEPPGSSESHASAEPSFPLDAAPPMNVETMCTPAELQALWDHVARTWSGLGEKDPYWSVLTEDRFRAGTIDQAALADFYGSGRTELDRLHAWLRRGGLDVGSDAACAEYGCGVGRITRVLARRFRRVVAFDVSGPHLRMARERMEADGIDNVRFVHVRGTADLAALAGTDLFYSVITLQHSPPPLIMDVLSHAFAGLRPGGCAFFQVPTYARGYAYRTAAHPKSAGMEMHFVPQRAILELAHRNGLMAVEVQPDWATGNVGEWISNTFLLTRPKEAAPSGKEPDKDAAGP